METLAFGIDFRDDTYYIADRARYDVYFADTAVSGCDNLQSIVAPDNSDDFGVVYTKPVNGGISTVSVSDDDISVEYSKEWNIEDNKVIISVVKL